MMPLLPPKRKGNGKGVACSPPSTRHNVRMSQTRWEDSVTPVPPPSAANPGLRTMLYAGVVTGAWSGLLSVAVFGLARLFRVPMEATIQGTLQPVPWFAFVLVPLLAAIVGGILALIMRGRKHARAVVYWGGTAIAIASCIGPLTQPPLWSTRIWLTIPHVITWFLVVPQIARIIGDSEPGRHEERTVLVVEDVL